MGCNKSLEIANLAVFALKTDKLAVSGYFEQNIANLVISGENLATYRLSCVFHCSKSPNRQFPEKSAKFFDFGSFSEKGQCCSVVS